MLINIKVFVKIIHYASLTVYFTSSEMRNALLKACEKKSFNKYCNVLTLNRMDCLCNYYIKFLEKHYVFI